MDTNQPITLTQTRNDDFHTLFRFQLDEEANHLAAFTSTDPNNKNAYLEKYATLLLNPTVTMRTIKIDQAIVGSLSKFSLEGKAEITYWIDKAFWGRGVATIALQKFLEIEQTRPLFARVAFDNFGSQRVLEKCGFVKVGTDSGFAKARGKVIEEFIYQRSG